MIECGLLSGDPLAHHGWTREQRIAAGAWCAARRQGVLSAWAFNSNDLSRWLERATEALHGLRDFLVGGLVVPVRRGRG